MPATGVAVTASPGAGPGGGVPRPPCVARRSKSSTDIRARSALTGLTWLLLADNTNLRNIQPVLDSTGLGAGDQVRLEGMSVSCTDVAALQAKGVTVTSNCS